MPTSIRRITGKYLSASPQPDDMRVIDNAGYKDITGVRRIPIARLIDPKTETEQVLVGNDEIDKHKARIQGKPYMSDTDMWKLFDGSSLTIEEKCDGKPQILLYGGYTFFCEGLAIQHTVDYDQVPYSQEGFPDMTVCYDVLDTEMEPSYHRGQGTGHWLNRSDKESLCQSVGAPVVAKVWEGHVRPEDLPNLADRMSAFGGKSKIEGLVLKNYKTGVFGKFINLEFISAISDEALQGGIHPLQRGIKNIRKWI